MNLDLNDFAMFDELQYQEYKRLKNKDYHENIYGCLAAIVLYLGIGFLVYYTTDIESDKLIPLMLAFFPYIWVIYFSLRIDRGYHAVFRFLTRKSRSYKAFKRLEKRYLPQEELIAAKIKSHLGNDISWNASPSFLSRNPKLLGYVEKAQEKIGSAYPMFESDIKKAKDLITNRHERSQSLDDSNSSRSSSKTIATKNASSKTKSARQDSSDSDSFASRQPISQLIQTHLSVHRLLLPLLKEKPNQFNHDSPIGSKSMLHALKLATWVKNLCTNMNKQS